MTDLATQARRPLEEYLTREYPFQVIADPDGGYVIIFPDLPGCMTQIETLDELPAMAEEARTLWIETAYEEGTDIPLPSYPEEYSGKFNVRLPHSLHRMLAEAAKREDMSLNQYVLAVLARGDAQARVERRLEQVEAQLAAIHARLHDNVVGAPRASRQRRGASPLQPASPPATSAPRPRRPRQGNVAPAGR